MDSKPLVSVIISSYNHEKYIEKTIQSVFDQEYPNWELIICDDGSKDNSQEIIRKFANSDRVSLMLNDVNRGQGAVLNQGIDKSRGKFICFLSSDDLYFPNKLALQVEKFLFCSQRVGIVYSYGAQLDDNTGLITPDLWPVHTGNIFQQLIMQNCIYPISPMFRREVFDLERFWEGFVAEGEALYVRIAQHYEAEFVPEITCAMRKHTYNTGRKTELMYDENIRWLSKFASTPGLSAEIMDLITERTAIQHRMSGLSFVRIEKDYERGWRALINALKTKPRYGLDWKILAGLALCLIHGLRKQA